MRFISMGFLLALSATLGAQSPFTIYNTSNSELPSDLVHVIFIDAVQNKWIGTEGGLVKIDADNNWTVFTEDNSGLPDNDIRALFYEPFDSTLWIGTFTQGLVKYDTVWTIYNPANSPVPDYHIKAITRDLNDTLWIGSLGGLTKWDGLDFWYTYTPDNCALLSANIPDIYVGENNVKYCGTYNGGLTTYDNGVFSTYKTTNSLITDNTILGIDEDVYHNIWLATSFGGLCIMTPDTTFLKFTPSTSDIVDYSLDDLTIDENNIGLLAMSSSGLETFDNINWTLYDSADSDLPDDYLNCITTDAENIIWIGTETQGLVVFDRTLIESIDNKATFSFSVYPNPATDHIILNGEIAGAALSIFTMEGKLISEKKLIANTEFIDVQKFISGNYIIKLTSNNGTSINNLVVLH